MAKNIEIRIESTILRVSTISFESTCFFSAATVISNGTPKITAHCKGLPAKTLKCVKIIDRTSKKLLLFCKNVIKIKLALIHTKTVLIDIFSIIKFIDSNPIPTISAAPSLSDTLMQPA